MFNNIVFMYFNEEFCHFGTYQQHSYQDSYQDSYQQSYQDSYQDSKTIVWTEQDPLYMRIGFTSDDIVFSKETFERECISVNLMEDPDKINDVLSMLNNTRHVNNVVNNNVESLNNPNYQFCWSLMIKYLIERFFVTVKDYVNEHDHLNHNKHDLDLKEIYTHLQVYIFIPSIINSDIKNLINELFRLEYPYYNNLRFFDSNDIITHYLKYNVKQSMTNYTQHVEDVKQGITNYTQHVKDPGYCDNNTQRHLHYIILIRDYHHTHIKYFMLDRQHNMLNSYNVREVDSITLNHGNYEIEELIKRVIIEHVKEGITNYGNNITNYVRSTSKFEDDDVLSIQIKCDRKDIFERYSTSLDVIEDICDTQDVDISYEDFLDVLLPSYYQSELDVIYYLANKYSSDGIIPILHLYGIIYERIFHRYLKRNVSLNKDVISSKDNMFSNEDDIFPFEDDIYTSVINYQPTDSIHSLLNAVGSVIVGTLDNPKHFPKQLSFRRIA